MSVKMVSALSSLTCMLCQKTIRLKEDDQLSQFEEHISDHHGVTFDTEFIYAASCLNSKERVDLGQNPLNTKTKILTNAVFVIKRFQGHGV